MTTSFRNPSRWRSVPRACWLRTASAAGVRRRRRPSLADYVVGRGAAAVRQSGGSGRCLQGGAGERRFRRPGEAARARRRQAEDQRRRHGHLRQDPRGRRQEARRARSRRPPAHRSSATSSGRSRSRSPRATTASGPSTPMPASRRSSTGASARTRSQAIDTARAYVEAQRDYAAEDRDDDGVLEYAQKLISSEGQTDGLYWPADEGDGDSPAGDLADRGGSSTRRRQGEGYFGYRFRILTGQGDNIAGGAYDYVINGNMIAGFALIAWPVKYAETGVQHLRGQPAGHRLRGRSRRRHRGQGRSASRCSIPTTAGR